MKKKETPRDAAKLSLKDNMIVALVAAGVAVWAIGIDGIIIAVILGVLGLMVYKQLKLNSNDKEDDEC